MPLPHIKLQEWLPVLVIDCLGTNDFLIDKKLSTFITLQFIYFYLVLRFSNILYLSLLDLTFAIDREGIDNPFIALGASVWLFVQVHRLGTCLYLLMDWYFGS